MKKTWTLVAMLATFALFELGLVWWSHGDPRTVTGLAAIAGVLSLPVAGLIALFVHRMGVESPRGASGAEACVGPIVVVGDVSRSVRVDVERCGVTVIVGDPPAGPHAQGRARLLSD